MTEVQKALGQGLFPGRKVLIVKGLGSEDLCFL